jgi:hypothetical protein
MPGGTATGLLTVSGGSWPDNLLTLYGPGTAWSEVDTPEGLQITADASRLAPGVVSDVLDIEFTPANASAVRRLVPLTIGPGLVVPATANVMLDGTATTAMLDVDTPIDAIGLSNVPWQATADVPWLTIGSPAGTSGSNLRVHVTPDVPDDTLSVGYVTITPTQHGVTSVAFAVAVDKRLPKVTSVGPTVLVAGAPHTVNLRGTSFASLPDLAGALSAPAGTSAPQLIDDGAATVALPDAPAGSTGTFSIANGIGAPVRSASVRWIAPIDLPASSISHPGLVDLTWDPTRQTLFAVDRQQPGVVAEHWANGTWTETSVALPYAGDLTMTADYTRLLVATGDGFLYIVDPDTLAVGASMSVGQPHPIAYAFLAGSDDVVWYAAGYGSGPGAYQWYSLNLATGAIGHPDWSLSPGCAMTSLAMSGAISRDGEHVFFGGCAGTMRTSDGIVHPVTGAVASWQFSHANDDGTRAIGAKGVVDGAMNLVGRIPQGKLDTIMSALLSPSGDRAYVLHAYGYQGPVKLEVYDTSSNVTPGGTLPLLGTITPVCQACSFDSTISIDGRTLFYTSDTGVSVVPIPEAYRSTGTLAGVRSHPRTQATRSVVTPMR